MLRQTRLTSRYRNWSCPHMSPLASLVDHGCSAERPSRTISWPMKLHHSYRKQAGITERGQADGDFAYPGEYLGQVRAVDGTPVVFGLQVVALGDGHSRPWATRTDCPATAGTAKRRSPGMASRRKACWCFDGPRGRIRCRRRSRHWSSIRTGKAVGQVAKIRRVSTTLGARASQRSDGAVRWHQRRRF